MGRGRAGSFGWASNAPFSGEEGAVEPTERPDEAEPVELVDAVEKEEAELTQQDKDLKAEDRVIKEKRVSALSLIFTCEEAHDDNATW